MSDSLDIAQDGHLFPRQEVAREVAQAIASDDWREHPVPRAAWWLTALGLALVALGLPIERVLVRAPTEFAVEGVGLDARYPIHLLARALGQTGIGVEAAFFALSAAAFGASLFVLGAILRSMGVGGRLALVCAFVALCSPLVLHHARLPSTVTLAVLGSSLVMWALVARSSSVLMRLTASCLGAWTFIASSIGPGAAQSPFGGVLGLLALGALWAALPLALFVRSAEESLPPFWLMTWCVASVAWTIAQEAPSAALVPVLTVLLAGSLVRFERAELAGRVAASALLAQLVATTIVITPRPTIPEWLNDRVNTLKPGYGAVVMTHLPVDDQRYLVELRAGAELIDANDREALDRASEDGRLVPLIEQLFSGTGYSQSGAPR